MPKQSTTRKRFKIALAYAGMTAKQFADARGITAGHLHQVLSGIHKSIVLSNDIEAFIEKHTRQAIAA